MATTIANASNKHGHSAVLFALACLLLFSVPAVAGTFHISPTLAEVSADGSTATFRLINPSDTPLTVQIDAVRWRQNGDETNYTKADDLMIVPPLVRIAPGKTQLVRIGHRNRQKNVEMAYRVRFHEVPSAPPKGFVGVQTALKLDVPLFFLADNPEGKLQWKAVANGNGLAVTILNSGTRYARFSKIDVQKNGHTIAQSKGPLYVLPGKSHTLMLPASGIDRGDNIRVEVSMGAARQTVPLTVE